MNRVTLTRLLEDTVKAVKLHETCLKKLEDFCEKNWHTTFHEIQSDMEIKGDHIVEWLDYGNGSVNVDAFIEFMNEHSNDQMEKS